MSSQVDSVSLPMPDWCAAAEEYVAPSNGAALPNPMRVSKQYDYCKPEGGARWLVEVLPHCSSDTQSIRVLLVLRRFWVCLQRWRSRYRGYSRRP